VFLVDPSISGERRVALSRAIKPRTSRRVCIVLDRIPTAGVVDVDGSAEQRDTFLCREVFRDGGQGPSRHA
jgi:hypothetical protein